MNKRTIGLLIPTYTIVFLAMFFGASTYKKATEVLAVTEALAGRRCIIIDAGHGGIDGGATSCSGVLESQINLDISLRFNDLLHLLGVDTVMIRNGDYSVYTQGKTIAQQKVSDLKKRVHVANTTQNAFLVSIHQNYFQDSRYYGPQVFYANTPGSNTAAAMLQNSLNAALSQGSKRKQKPAKGIYLMDNITCDGILIECGFLSNPAEEKKLLSPAYQKKLCCVLASVLTNHLIPKQLS